MIILGINAYHADAAAAIVIDGRLIAAVEEERFIRIKHCAGFPKEAIKYCLGQAGVSLREIDYIVIPRQPRARSLKKLYYAIKIPRLAVRRLTALRKTRNIKNKLAEVFAVDEKEIKAKFINVEHHRAHLASSFFVSGFKEALLFSADGLGDFASTVWATGQDNKITVLGEIGFPHSLGMYYTAITQYLGFLDYGDEYKVMGLAAFGEAEYKREFKKIIFHDGNLRVRLGLDYFLHHKKLADMHFEDGYPSLEALYSPYLVKRLGPPRQKSGSIERRHQNIATTLQERLEEVVFAQLNQLHKRYKFNQLCMAGGVAFNCVVNGKIFEHTPFEKVYIQPAAGDAGLAIGAAYYLWHQLLNKPRDFVMEHAYWGPAYNELDVSYELGVESRELNRQRCRVTRIGDKDELCQKIAQEIAAGKVVGWFQGRMEWGPRALGNRSILADPRRREMQDMLNAKIKYRESFRPFAPAILEEDTVDYFEDARPSNFMLFAYKVKEAKKQLIPAVVHIDGTARIQTVSKKTNPLFWKLIIEFKKITGIPLILNTSFNENEPIICKPQEAIDCFLRTQIDVLVVGDYILRKYA